MIYSTQIKLDKNDIEFIKKHSLEFDENERITLLISELNKKEEEKRRIREEKERIRRMKIHAHNKMLVEQAKKDLERQIAASKIHNNLPKKQKELYDRCKNNDISGCMELAMWYTGVGQEHNENVNYKFAREFYKKACNLPYRNRAESASVLLSCYDYAKYLYAGTGGYQDTNKAISLYKKSCEIWKNNLQEFPRINYVCKEYERIANLTQREIAEDVKKHSDFFDTKDAYYYGVLSKENLIMAEKP